MRERDLVIVGANPSLSAVADPELKIRYGGAVSLDKKYYPIAKELICNIAIALIQVYDTK